MQFFAKRRARKARTWDEMDEAALTPEQRQRKLLDNAFEDPQGSLDYTPPTDEIDGIPVGQLYQESERLDPKKNPEAYDISLRPELCLQGEEAEAQARASRKIAMDRVAEQYREEFGTMPKVAVTVEHDITEVI